MISREELIEAGLPHQYKSERKIIDSFPYST
jgi:hypothetical protein